jgi:lipopolysaccharide export system protein LptA
MASSSWFSIRRLRWALVLGACSLLVVLAAYIGYARLYASRFKFKLPPGLGLTLDPETGGFVYSPTKSNRTLFTLRASRNIRHKDGNVSLYNVGLDLFGKDGQRTSRIHGDHFEYDSNHDVVTAVGDVYIDLMPPPPAGQPTAQKQDLDAHIIHVKTSGLVFRQKEQVAETPNRIEFTASGMSGNAVGARYDSDAGVVILQHDVHASGLRGSEGQERPMVLTARHAELHRDDNTAVLEQATLVSASATGSQTGSANYAVAHLTPEGVLQRVDASGEVKLTGEGRGTVTSNNLEMTLNAKGQPSAAHLFGDVHFADDEEARNEVGKSDDARLAFDAEGRPIHALMTGDVEAEVSEGANHRVLDGDRVELNLAGGGKQPVEIRTAEATARSGARMRLVDQTTRQGLGGKVVAAIERTQVVADQLTARFRTVDHRSEVQVVDGTGRTQVERTLADVGANDPQWKESGTGDTLKLNFEDSATGKGRAALSRAEQRGSVRLVREAAPATPGAAPEIQHAQGDDAIYEAALDRMTLTGVVKVSDPSSALFADRVELDRGSGDGQAEGHVRVTYVDPNNPKSEPVHVIAARAQGHKSTGVTQFFALPGEDARLWQGGSQVEAPVLDLDRTRKTLLAHAATPGDQRPVVQTVLVDNSAQKPGARPKSAAPVRVFSREMLYTDATRQVEFSGAVQVNDQDGVLRARQATVFLTAKDAQPASQKDATGTMSLGGNVDHIIATGDVQIEEPGRRGTGDRLVYTARDQLSVLTGTKAVPPRVVDDQQGTVTGAELRFRRGDDSVEVRSGAGAQRVHVETHLKPKDQK